ncbi:hypothetical protein AKO1_006938 [Acrasis kona]|uniref:Uncharacterized protein n=1 Tax=Acrasis kona TaxID=1008807 RepID=A0AAW2YWY2_9EUKA
MLKVEDPSNPKLLVTREHITSMQHKLQVENIKHFGDVCTRSDLCRTTTDDTFFRLYSVGIGFGYIIWAFLGEVDYNMVVDAYFNGEDMLRIYIMLYKKINKY